MEKGKSPRSGGGRAALLAALLLLLLLAAAAAPRQALAFPQEGVAPRSGDRRRVFRLPRILRRGRNRDSKGALHTEVVVLPPGLQNQGNTCYLNSLLQTVYHIEPFRSAVLEDGEASRDKQARCHVWVILEN